MNPLMNPVGSNAEGKLNCINAVVITQKKFTVDFLSKKMKPNEGEVPQYYVENSHPPIISPDIWEAAQEEMQRRRSLGKNHNCRSPFSAKLICADCGEFFGSKTWHSTSKYRRTVWQCNAKFKGESKCTTPHLYEDDIRFLFMQALNVFYADRSPMLEKCRKGLAVLNDHTKIDAEAEELQRELEVVAGLIHKLIQDNAGQPLDQEEYRNRYDAYAARFGKLQEQLDDLQTELEIRQSQADVIGGFMFELQEMDVLPLDFDERMWNALIDHATVHADGRLAFVFRNGRKINV